MFNYIRKYRSGPEVITGSQLGDSKTNGNGAPGANLAAQTTKIVSELGDRQLSSPSIGLAHNLGGIPNRNIASINVLGLHQV